MESIEIRLAQPVNLEGVEIYIQRASVSLVLSIVDAEGNWLLSVSSSFSAAPLDSPAGAHAWVTRYLSLKRVNVLHLRASPVTPNSSAQAGNWSVGVLEIRLHSTPLLACAGGGFLGNQEDCEAPVMLPSSLEALDCQGEWEDWSICDVSCTRMRQFNVVSPPKRGGRPCPSHELEPCTGNRERPYADAGTLQTSSSSQLSLKSIFVRNQKHIELYQILKDPLVGRL